MCPAMHANERRGVLFNGVSPDYFRTMGTPLLAGRDIADTDRAGAPEVIIVNEAFAKKYFNGENPIGRRFDIVGFNDASRRGTWRSSAWLPTRNTSASARRRSRSCTAPSHRSARSAPARAWSIRTTGAPFDSRNAIVQAIAGVNKDIAVDLKTLDEDLGANVLQERLVATLSGFFGGLALLLAALGLYGVMSYTVTRRRTRSASAWRSAPNRARSSAWS